MTDKELLELAARAAGVTLRYNSIGTQDARYAWKPLEDDGEAFRLAVKMGFRIIVDYDLSRSHAYCDASGRWVTSPHNDNPVDATRRAVVGLAAEIGRQQKP